MRSGKSKFLKIQMINNTKTVIFPQIKIKSDLLD
jgi:hypothetical protein